MFGTVAEPPLAVVFCVAFCDCEGAEPDDGGIPLGWAAVVAMMTASAAVSLGVAGDCAVAFVLCRADVEVVLTDGCMWLRLLEVVVLERSLL